MSSTQKDKEENGGQLMDSSLVTSGENQLEHNEDFFPTLPNTAYGTAGKINGIHYIFLLFHNIKARWRLRIITSAL